MNLSFLSPLAFQLLYALPLLFLPYVLRNREKTLIVPALFLYEGLPTASRRRLWGRLRLTPSFLLQLLILLLLIAAAAQPFLHGQGSKIALVLDTSASMQAHAPDGTDRLFDLAKQHAAQALETIPTSDSISLFVSNPLPRLVASSSENRGSLHTELSLMSATDAPDVNDDILSAFFSNLMGEQGFQHVFFFTDRPLAAPVNTNALTVVTVGGAQPNWSITAFRLYRSPFAPDEVDATITVTGAERPQNFTLSIEDADTGNQLVSRSVTDNNAGDFSFSRLPAAQAYRARLNIEDGLALDNEAYAVLPSLTNVSVLLVSPSANVAASLNAIPNLQLERVSPQEYTPAKAARFAFVLFHLTTPDAFPPTNAAFLLPPAGNALFPLGKATKHVQVTQWMTAHPLTSYVTFSLFTPAYAEALQPVDWRQAIVNATVGPIVLAGEREGKRYVATGFDILPYLGVKNLPVSIFTLNLLGWLADQAGQPPSVKTGTTLTLAEASATVRFSDNENIKPTGNTVLLLKQGLYTVTEYGVERRVAVNLTDAQESQLARPLSLAPLSAPAPVAPETTGQPLWPWLLVGALFLLVLDRWFAVRSHAVSQAG